MAVVGALVASILLFCFGVCLVQAYQEAKRENRPVSKALLRRTLVVFVQLWV